MLAPTSQPPADPQHDEGPETNKPYASIVGAQQNNRQRAPKHSRRQAAHRQGASEQLANATHRQGYQAAAKQPPQGGAEREEDDGVLACACRQQHPEATTQRPQTCNERQQVDGRGKAEDEVLHPYGSYWTVKV